MKILWTSIAAIWLLLSSGIGNAYAGGPKHDRDGIGPNHVATKAQFVVRYDMGSPALKTIPTEWLRDFGNGLWGKLFLLPPPSCVLTTCVGHNLHFDATVTNAVSYDWTFDDGATATIGNPIHRYATAGTYLVGLSVTDSHGCVSSSTQLVCVSDAPSATVQTVNPACSGASTGAIDVTVSGGAPGTTFTYRWSTGQATQDLANVPPGIYALTITDPITLCDFTLSTTLTATDVIKPTISCPDNATMSVDRGVCTALYRYQVLYGDNCPNPTLTQTSGQPSNTQFPLGNTLNTFIVKDAALNDTTCTFRITVVDRDPPTARCQSITVTNGTNGTYTITPSMLNSGSIDGCSPVTFTASTTTFNCANAGPNTVVLTVSDASGNTSTCNATVTIPTPAAPVITASGSTTFCSGSNVTLTGSSGFNSYRWSTGATTQSIVVTTAGTYGLTATNAAGCGSTAIPMTVTVIPSPTPTITPNGPLIFCANNTLQLDAGLGYSSYRWSTGATTQTIMTNTTAIYRVTVTNAQGCIGSASVSTTVLPLPVVSVSSNPGDVICFGAPVTLTATPGFVAYNWNPGTSNVKVVTSPGSYLVDVTGANGCHGVAARTVTSVTSCVAPTNLTANSITATSAVLFWTPNPCAASYTVRYKLSTAPANSWTTITPNVNAPSSNVNVNGLIPNRTYQWQVRTNCNNNSLSGFSPTATFSTPPLAFAKENGISGEGLTTEATLYPNPNNGKFTVKYYTLQEVPLEICIWDMNGKRVYCEKKTALTGENTWEMDFKLSAGVYFFRVESILQGQAEAKRIRFVVE